MIGLWLAKALGQLGVVRCLLARE